VKMYVCKLIGYFCADTFDTASRTHW